MSESYFRHCRHQPDGPLWKFDSDTYFLFLNLRQRPKGQGGAQASNWYALVLELPHLYTFGTLSFFDCDGTRLMLTQNEQLNASESVLYFREDGTEEWMAFFKDPDGRPMALMAQTSPAQKP